MKKLFLILLTIATFAMSADVKPFVFENIESNDSAQQASWDLLMKYKIYGQTGITFKGGRIFVPDKSGWFGTSQGDFDVSGGNQDHLVGGPILIGGNMSFNDGHDTISTGPVRVLGNVTVGNFNSPNVINGTQCVSGTVSQKYINEVPVENRYFGDNYESCPPEVPQVDTNLTIPVFLDTFTYNSGINLNNSTGYIDVPAGEDTYDYHINNISMTNNSRLVIRMPLGGRLTRVFIKEGFSFSAHPKISIMYMAEDAEFVDGHWTGEGSIINNKDYSGNLLFYTTKDIIWPAINSTDSIQGTFITTGKISIEQHMTLAGQLLANNISINFNFDGSGFLYVPFDPPVLNIDPTALASGKFVENNKDVIIPIHLDTLAKTDVFFKYCFILDNKVTQDDFNVSVPECGKDSGKVKILMGDSLPQTNVYLNVKADGISEGDEILKLHIYDLQGAVMPGNVKSGDFRLTLADPVGFEIDTTWKYTYFENEIGVVDIIRVIGKSDSTKFRLDSAAHGIYTLDSITGELTLNEPLDYETVQIDTIKVTVTDISGLTDTRYIPITIKDINEAPTIKDTTITLKENLPIPSIVGTLKATDPDTENSTFRQNVFTLIEGNSNFVIDNSGRITATKIFDYENDSTEYKLKVKVYDKTDPSLFDTATVTIKIGNTNEGPKFPTKDTTLYVAENTKPGIIGNVAAKDEDGDTITYKIVGNVPFTIDTAGNISSTREFDFEKETGFTFKVVATSTDLTDTMKVTVKVTNENEPVHINDTTFTVKENYTGPIGKVEGKDEDGEPVKYTISDTTDYYISSVGSITLKTPFDYETKNTDTVTVYVTTPSGDKDSAKVVIKVQNVNETPVLQPNDTLKVPENCKNCIVGIITATDPDKDPIKYTVKEPGFTIDSAGVLKLTEPLDYEKTPVVIITVTATDQSGAGDTATYKIKVTDINEPVHTKDTTCSVEENYTGNVCKIPGTDDDGTKPTFIVTDTTNYKIDSTGQLVIKNPIDYEKKSKDTVKVIVTDGEFYDTATVIINVLDEDEIPEITKIDDKPPVDTIKTNDPDHKIEYNICEKDNCENGKIDITVHKDTTVKVCNTKKTKCDSVVILFNDVPPVVTLTNAKSTNAYIDYITIEEQKDDKIYVNKKENPITVTVKDTIHNTKHNFEINVKLDTIPTKDIKLKEYNYLIDETKATVKPIGGNKGELVEIIKDNGTEVTIKQIIDLNTGKPIDTVQTVSYTKKVNGKDVVVTYKTDNLTGQKIGDYEVSYMADSCTKVTYTMNDNKQIIKNDEGNIGYTITYDYVDDFGNKASASVEIVYDDIPPKVEILEPYEHEIFKTNAITVKWTVNGEVKDTLTLQRLEKGPNTIIRRYVDKAGNEAADTVWVIMKEAKDIDITIIHPVTEINKDKVDEFYSTGEKYDPKKPYKVTMVNPKDDSLPETIGIGFKIDIALPSVSPTGGLATLDDIVKNGQIPVDDNGNIVGASNLSIPVEQYVEEHCTAEFQEDYRKNGLNIPLYDVKYNLHLWVWSNTANYVNDFNVEYTLNDQEMTSEAGTVQMVVDWLADKEGSVRAKGGKALGTGAYLVKLYSKSVAKHRCDYKDQVKGDKTVKKEENMKTFGYKRPTKK